MIPSFRASSITNLELGAARNQYQYTVNSGLVFVHVDGDLTDAEPVNPTTLEISIVKRPQRKRSP
jgi:hypothetical protein